MGSGRRQVIWSTQAAAALDEAVAYVYEDSPSAAIQLLESTLAAASSLAEFPDRGRHVPELASPITREVLVQRYRLMYEVTNDQVSVVAFLHGARDFAKWQRGE